MKYSWSISRRGIHWAKFALWLWCVLVPGIAAADRPANRVVVVVGGKNKEYADAVLGVREALSKAAQIRELSVEHLDGSTKAKSDLVNALELDPPSIIITIGTSAADALQGAFGSIPRVYGLVSDPRRYEDLPRSSVITTEFPIDDQIRWLRRILPQVKNVGVLYDPRSSQRAVEQAEREMKKHGLRLVGRKIESPDALPAALRSIAREIDVLWALNDPLVVSPETAKTLLVFSYRNRIPFVGLAAPWVKAGAIYALDRDYRDMGAQCGELALEILGDAASTSQSKRYPRKVTYSLNESAAEHMKLNLEPEILEQALEVYR